MTPEIEQALQQLRTAISNALRDNQLPQPRWPDQGQPIGNYIQPQTYWDDMNRAMGRVVDWNKLCACRCHYDHTQNYQCSCCKMNR